VVDAERVEAIEAALMALGDGSPALRARLLAILALELLWSGDTNRPSALSDEALALARSHGEPSVLGPVLAMRAGTLWNPRWARERLDIATELLSIAEVAGDPYLHFWALYRRTAAFLELGDTHEAEACRRAAEREADDLGQPHPRWAVMFFKVAAAVASGRLADAKNAAQEILTLGRDSGQPDAEPLYAVLLATIRYQQGRLGELETVLADTVGRLPAVPYFRALLALAYCELDRPTDARFVFTSLARGDLRSLLFDYLAGPTAALLAIVCAEVGDADGAAVLTEVIAPYASQVASHPLMWLGSFSHHLGLLATTLGRWSEAEAHFRTAASTHERLGAPAWLARTRLEWARMLLAGAEPGGGERAHDLLRQALGTARELGLANIERRAVELLSSE
jgi:tetratricopeptide (TPR) repeat protein